VIVPVVSPIALSSEMEVCEAQIGSVGDTPAEMAPPETVCLADGAEVWLRDATPADADGLRRMFFQLGDTTRYRYFFVGAPSTPDWAERVVALGVADGERSYALVAEIGESLVGVARFDRTSDGASAEIGVLFVDAWQSRGLGRHALLRLQLVAQQWGIAAFTGMMLGENDRALRLARRAFPAVRVHWEQGAYDLRVELAPTPGPSPKGRGVV